MARMWESFGDGGRGPDVERMVGCLECSLIGPHWDDVLTGLHPHQSLASDYISRAYNNYLFIKKKMYSVSPLNKFPGANVVWI